MKISNLARSAACDAVVDLMDVGAPASTLNIRSGAAPTNTTDADSGSLCVSMPLPDPLFGSASNGVATANNITSATVTGTFTAGHFRIKDGNGVVIAQGSVALTSGGDLNFDNITFVAGGTCAITNGSLTVTMPAGS